ncbi:MAG TPA: hypothetical protein VFT91_02305, partial [Dehalococcoidia bacterium]|nr:hypothetical protein [Dehalococcoidia bacterium]
LSPSSIRRRAFWEGYTKARLRERRRQSSWEGINLSPEREQLRRLAVSFLPGAMIGLIRQPRQSWRRLLLAGDAVGHVALGYAAGSIPALGPQLCRRYAE